MLLLRHISSISFLLLLLLLFTTIRNGHVHARQVHFTIGGLFYEGNSQIEMAFKYAIARHNMYNNHVKFRTNIQRISRADSFTTSKIVCNMAASDEGLVAIFGPPSNEAAGAMVQSVCANLEIPHIQVAWTPQLPLQHQTIVNVFPDHELLATAYGTIVQHMDWRSYAILYESNQGLSRLSQVLRLTSAKTGPIMVRQLEHGSGADYRPLLKEVKNSTQTQIILDCAVDNVLPVLRQAKEVGMLDYLYSYFLTALDAHALDFASLGLKANITVLRIFDPDNPLLTNAVLDWIQGESNTQNYISISPNDVKAESVLMHDAVNFFTSIVQQLHITEAIVPESVKCNENRKWPGGFRISNFMKIKHMMNAITGPVKLNEQGNRIDFTLHLAEIIKNKAETTGTWSPTHPSAIKFKRTSSEQMQQIFENLQNTEMIISSRLGPPYLREVVAREGEQELTGNDRYEGYSKDLIYHLSKHLNFTFRFELTADGSYKGLIDDLLQRKAHLALCDLTITNARSALVDFSMPFMTLGVSILYSKPKKADANIYAFMDPFGLEVWFYTVTLYLSVSVMLYFIARMAPGDWENPHPCDQNPEEYENIWDLKNCLWITLGSIMTQGCDILPKGISTRWGVSMWFFFSLIMTSSYTANLAAFLTMSNMAPSIDSAEALVKQTKIKYGTVDGGSTQTFFRESNYTTYARMWTQMSGARPSVFEKSNTDGVKRVLTTKNQLYAFLMESSQIEYEVQKNCDLKQVGGRLDSKSYGIAMPMNSPYRSAISKYVLKLQEDGTLSILKNKWWREKIEIDVPCDDDEAPSGADLRMTNVGGIFIALGMGIAIAFLLAIVEFLWNVRNVAIDEHITYWEALIVELKFAIKVWNTKKRVKPQLSESSSSTSSSSSHEGGEDTENRIAKKLLKGASASSILQIDQSKT